MQGTNIQFVLYNNGLLSTVLAVVVQKNPQDIISTYEFNRKSYIILPMERERHQTFEIQ